MSDIYSFNLLIMQLIIILILLFIAISIVRINRVSRLEKRFSKYTIATIKSQQVSFIDQIVQKYIKCRSKLNKILNKSKAFKDYSKKYTKYSLKSNSKEEDPIHYISDKIFAGILGIIIIILSDVLRFNEITLLQIITAFLLGFFVPDIFLISKDRMRKHRVEKDMLKAIIIMNNSFKSGLSIMQAIYMVYHELEGPISDEFKKMYLDLSFGLSMESVFERFTKRVDTSDAHYIATSLNVLNKTGGNIVQVFASVERNAFTRKKLEEELGSLSASANAIFKILVGIPILLFIGIFMLNPAYFLPLITTPIGFVFLLLIILIYVLYIVIIRKIVKVKVVI